MTTKTEEMEAWAAGDTYQNKGELWRSGINIGADEFNAVEAYGQTKEIAEARRDLILATRSHDSRLADELARWMHRNPQWVNGDLFDRILDALRSTPAPDALRFEAALEATCREVGDGGLVYSHAQVMRAYATLRTEGSRDA